MNTERDKFLYEYFGECWHEWDKVVFKSVNDLHTCKKCNVTATPLSPSPKIRADFSKWEWFGWLLNKAKDQEWWDEFVGCASLVKALWKGDMNLTIGQLVRLLVPLIQPDILADSLYEFLKRKKELKGGTMATIEEMNCFIHEKVMRKCLHDWESIKMDIPLEYSSRGLWKLKYKRCKKCGKETAKNTNPDYFTEPEHWFKLWNTFKEMPEFEEFIERATYCDTKAVMAAKFINLISLSVFPESVYEFFKSKETKDA